MEQKKVDEGMINLHPTYYRGTWPVWECDELSNCCYPLEWKVGFKKALAGLRQRIIDSVQIDTQYEGGTWVANNLTYLEAMRDIGNFTMTQLMGKNVNHYDILQKSMLMNIDHLYLEWRYRYAMYVKAGIDLKLLPVKSGAVASVVLGVEGFKEPFIGRAWPRTIRGKVATAYKLSKSSIHWFDLDETSILKDVREDIFSITPHESSVNPSNLYVAVKLKYDTFFGKNVHARLPVSVATSPVVFSPVELYLLKLAQSYLIDRCLKICNRNGAKCGDKFSLGGRVWRLCEPNSVKLDVGLGWYLVENPYYVLPENGNPYRVVTDSRLIERVDID
jgi:hypothetical protein|nr:MAG TPA: hypothetical protein [Caudoviricetes sp.]